jgi:hypothetical protein
VKEVGTFGEDFGAKARVSIEKLLHVVLRFGDGAILVGPAEAARKIPEIGDFVLRIRARDDYRQSFRAGVGTLLHASIPSVWDGFAKSYAGLYGSWAKPAEERDRGTAGRTGLKRGKDHPARSRICRPCGVHRAQEAAQGTGLLR